MRNYTIDQSKQTGVRSTPLEHEKRSLNTLNAQNLNGYTHKSSKLARMDSGSKVAHFLSGNKADATEDLHMDSGMISRHYKNSTQNTSACKMFKVKDKKVLKKSGSRDLTNLQYNKGQNKQSEMVGYMTSDKVEDCKDSHANLRNNKIYSHRKRFINYGQKHLSVDKRGRVHTTSPKRASQMTKGSNDERNDILDSLKKNLAEVDVLLPTNKHFTSHLGMKKKLKNRSQSENGIRRAVVDNSKNQPQ